MNKKIIAVVAALLIAAAVWYFYNKKKAADLPDTGAQDAFAADDTAAYEKAKAIVNSYDRGALSWVNPIVLEAYKSGRADFKVKGRISKVSAFVRQIGTLNKLSDADAAKASAMVALSGATEVKGVFYTDKLGAKVHWPQEMFDRLWAECLIPFESNYGGI